MLLVTALGVISTFKTDIAIITLARKIDRSVRDTYAMACTVYQRICADESRQSVIGVCVVWIYYGFFCECNCFHCDRVGQNHYGDACKNQNYFE